MVRPKLSVEYVMTKQRYLNILKLIQEYSNARFPKYITIDHLRYKLLDNWKKFDINEQEMLKFFRETPFYSKTKKTNKSVLQEGYITKERYDKVINNLEIMQRRFDFPSDEKISDDANLKKYLRNLKKLGLLKQIPVKKGKPYYICTEKGMDKFLRYRVEQVLKQIPDGSDAMYDIYEHIKKIYRKIYWGKRKK